MSSVWWMPGRYSLRTSGRLTARLLTEITGRALPWVFCDGDPAGFRQMPV